MEKPEYLTTGVIFSTLDLIALMRLVLVSSFLGLSTKKEYLNIMERCKPIIAIKP